MLGKYRGPASAIGFALVLSVSLLALTAIGPNHTRIATLQAMLAPVVQAVGLVRLIGIVLALGLIGAWITWPRRPAGLHAAAGPAAGAGDADESLGAERLRRLTQARRREADGLSDDGPPYALDAERARQRRTIAEEQAESDRLARADAANASQALVAAEVKRARGHPIVFAQHYPPPARAGLSGFGGRPTVPPDFRWPHAGTGKRERPLHFVMQWDCAELATQDATGLLPTSGLLYCFADLDPGGEPCCLMLHRSGQTRGWTEMEPPETLGPVYGQHAPALIPYCTPDAGRRGREAPALLPHWPFTPRAIAYPAQEPDGAATGGEAGRFWQDDVAAPALLAAQIAQDPLLAQEAAPPAAKDALRRPFDGFPHDWAAVRILAARAIAALSAPLQLPATGALAQADEATRAARIAEWREQAIEMYRFAAAHPLKGAVAAELVDDIWAWAQSIAPALAPGFAALVQRCIDTSLVLGSAGTEAISPEWLARGGLAHALAFAAGTQASGQRVHAPRPTRMFGPASALPGANDELIADHLLLLELVANDAIGHHLGTRVFQLLITPDDLREGHFDKARLIVGER